jgi:hypothetical protein
LAAPPHGETTLGAVAFCAMAAMACPPLIKRLI